MSGCGGFVSSNMQANRGHDLYIYMIPMSELLVWSKGNCQAYLLTIA